MTDKPALPAVGEIIGDRFRIEELIGTGGMGAVYRATQLNLGRDVALKLLLPRHAGVAISRARFEREARVASVLRHPNAMEIYDFGDDEGRLYIAMQLLHGQSLRHECPPGGPPVAVARILDLGYQIADLLATAHAIPLVHRDLKPENIFVEKLPSGLERVVVADFGLAFSSARVETGRLTTDDVVAGTPVYMSPEQAAGDELGPPSDIYSLGCILYELATGAVPFEGEGAVVLARHLFAPLTAPLDRRPGLALPPLLDEIICRMLAKRTDHRPTAMEVRAALAAIDPETTAARQRSRDETYLLGREARMLPPTPVPERATATEEPGLLHGGPVRLAVTRRLADDVVTALAATRLDVFELGGNEPDSGVAAIYAPGASPAEVRHLAKGGRPVLADSDAKDLTRITELLRAGAAEVVTLPFTVDDLARKIHRAIRKARGGSRR